MPEREYAPRERCPGKRWSNQPGRVARCADCGRTFRLIGREFGRGWGRTRLPNHKREAVESAVTALAEGRGTHVPR